MYWNEGCWIKADCNRKQRRSSRPRSRNDVLSAPLHSVRRKRVAALIGRKFVIVM